MPLRLSNLPLHTQGTIVGFDQDDIVLKLMEMGFIPGEKVSIEHVSPAGDPIVITVSGYLVSLRLNEASKILVELVN
jgi:ferrous iron transport protein A